MVGGLARRAGPVAPVAGRDVDLAAEDRVDAALAGGVVEHHRREHVAVLGDSQRRHLQRRCLIEQLVDAAGAVEQRVLGVQVEVDELTHRRGSGPGLGVSGGVGTVNALVLVPGPRSPFPCSESYSHSMVLGGFELMS